MPTKCIDFLTRKRKDAIVPVYVVFGDEEFLRRQACRKVRELVVGLEPDDFVYSSRPGDDVKLSDVLDELRTPPFLGERRLTVVEKAENFVTRYRDALLRYVSEPSEHGVLLLDTKTWAANTKLYKAVEESGLNIEAAAPKAWHTPAWCVEWCSTMHGKKIAKPVAEWLVELVGPILGLLDQELAKLATYIGDRPAIEKTDVDLLVAGTRTENVFKLFDLALEGQVGKALVLLDRQFVAGDSPVMVLAMLSSQLRKLTRAARAVVAGQPMTTALEAAGVQHFAVEKSSAQLRRLGRQKMAGMFRALLSADLALKGGAGFEPRTVIERFLVELGATQDGQKQ